ncbi:hypothetical protein RNJ44_01416 [Nakaseomyces bracarensis]|uniref:Outer spore wall protein 5 n=1 Tax=Nakaseomyces bracarensis TaxID=273131 RepID=A0ABR4NPS1_9SACH
MKKMLRGIVTVCGSLVVMPLLVGATWFAICVVVSGTLSNTLYQIAVYIYLRTDVYIPIDPPPTTGYEQVQNTPQSGNQNQKYRYSKKKKFDLNVLQRNI